MKATRYNNHSCHALGFLGDIFALPASLQKFSPLLSGLDMFDFDRPGKTQRGDRGAVMIRDITEFSTSLRYISGWADKLEGLRQHSEETEASLLSTTSAGPLMEIRRVLLETREFVEGLTE